jgi:glycerol-3-phosphate acyltransferase PlsY
VNPTLAVLYLLAVAYVAGSVPFGVLVGRLRGVDILAAGSKNIGATNVARLLGRPWGILVFALDVLKGLAPTMAAGFVLRAYREIDSLRPITANLGWLTVAITCVLGHNFSIFLRFRGGKGVATSLGAALGVFPELTIPGLGSLAVWGAVVSTSRYVSLGSVTACGVFPLLAMLYSVYRGHHVLQDDWPFLLFALLAAGLSIYRHRANLRRLRMGTEPRIGRKPAAEAVASRPDRSP